MRLVHTADLHLMRGSEPRARCAFAAFQKVRELAAASGAQLLVIAGDAFHSPADAQDGPLLERVRAELDLLAPAETLLIPGNHECQGGARPFRSASDFGRHCRVFTEPGVWRRGPVAVFAFPFRAGARTAELFAGLGPPEPGEIRVAVLHGTAVDRPDLGMYAMENEEPGGDLLVSDADLARAGFRYAALGHVHKPDAWTLPNGGAAAYAGSPWCVTVGEEAPRSARVVDLDEAAGEARHEAVPLGTPRALRRSFFAAPGAEAALAREIEDFLKSQPPEVWPVAYVKGIGDKAALDMALEEARRRAAPGRVLPPEARVRDRDFRQFAGPGAGLPAQFLDRMRRRLDGAQGEEREVLMRAAALGWLALENPGGRPEEELLSELEAGLP